MRIEARSQSCCGRKKATAAMLVRRGGVEPKSPASRLATLRLMHVAAETGARFIRERIDHDPLDWLLTRRKLFDERSAVEVCGRPEGFRRAVVLHGLSLGLDTAPTHVARIPAHEFLSHTAMRHLQSERPPRSREADPWEAGPMALYSCSISAELPDGHIQVFGAMIARSPNEVRQRLRQRYGPLLEDQALVRIGFDWSEPLASAMVSEAMAHVLRIAAAEPTSPFAHGLDFQVEQRFAA
ncbi:hypothetical protein [Sphingomonas xanthus]|uniref:Uncharacterized protein n=1 Tax=Sphingomonas xanthus TaxID=2594473 RepID=A0A516IQ67_9SPHN|nr:hypothetical protein [Sphingomonas xanthus]QDP19061.1 hypothetical protein FMM02_03255 [Sphingomonas xanthus]